MVGTIDEAIEKQPKSTISWEVADGYDNSC